MKATRIVTAALVALLFALSATALFAHDLFLRPTRYFVPEYSDVQINVLNGTFTKSEGSITRDRLRALDLLSPAGLAQLDTSAWVASKEMSVLTLRTGRAGTYVVGASTRPRELQLDAKEFNEYLATDGVPDILAERRRNRELGRPARERYHKHVKTVIEVGGAYSTGQDLVFGYPAELVPLENPYMLRAGATLRLRALVDGRPVANQYVVSGGRTNRGARIAQRATRSDKDGIVRVPLRSAGVWYVKFIHMARATGDTTIDYESKWASLTFAVR